MTEMQAAIGRIQLRKMPAWHRARASNAEKVLSACRSFPDALRVPVVPDYIDHAWYKCYVFVRSEGLKDDWNRDRIMSKINELDVPCYSGSCSEVYLEKAFDNTGYRPDKRLPVAKKLGECSLMFLVHPTLTEAEIDKTCSTINSVMESASI